VKLVDEPGEAGEPVPQGQSGQIVVHGRPGWSMMKGYFKNPEATAQTIREGWLWTGDTAYQDREGYFHFVDRAKDMMKRAGEHVAASEDECNLSRDVPFCYPIHLSLAKHMHTQPGSKEL
jgi:crotonobetaine/carnitine-CoA ligase